MAITVEVYLDSLLGHLQCSKAWHSIRKSLQKFSEGSHFQLRVRLYSQTQSGASAREGGLPQSSRGCGRKACRCRSARREVARLMAATQWTVPSGRDLTGIQNHWREKWEIKFCIWGMQQNRAAHMNVWSYSSIAKQLAAGRVLI